MPYLPACGNVSLQNRRSFFLRIRRRKNYITPVLARKVRNISYCPDYMIFFARPKFAAFFLFPICIFSRVSSFCLFSLHEPRLARLQLWTILLRHCHKFSLKLSFSNFLVAMSFSQYLVIKVGQLGPNVNTILTYICALVISSQSVRAL